MNFMDIARFIERAPSALKLAGGINEARKGNPEALQYLLREGWKDGLEVYNPMYRNAAEIALPRAREAVSLFQSVISGNVIDGDYRVIVDPWVDVVRHVRAETYGAHVIVGPVGSGKTNLALRLAEVWRARHGYPVYVVAGYPGDLPDWAERASMTDLYEWVETLMLYLEPAKAQELEDEEEEEKPKRRKKKRRPVTERDIRAMSKRVIIIDEASMSMGGISSVGRQMARDVAACAMTQCRHTKWLVIYIGQLLRHIREDLRSNATLFVKQPSGQEDLNDRSDDPFVKNTWRTAGAAFEDLRRKPWYTNQPDLRSWSWVRSPMLGGHGFDGVMMPCGLVGDPLGSTGFDEEEQPDIIDIDMETA